MCQTVLSLRFLVVVGWFDLLEVINVLWAQDLRELGPIRIMLSDPSISLYFADDQEFRVEY